MVGIIQGLCIRHHDGLQGRRDLQEFTQLHLGLQEVVPEPARVVHSIASLTTGLGFSTQRTSCHSGSFHTPPIQDMIQALGWGIVQNALMHEHQDIASLWWSISTSCKGCFKETNQTQLWRRPNLVVDQTNVTVLLCKPKQLVGIRQGLNSRLGDLAWKKRGGALQVRTALNRGPLDGPEKASQLRDFTLPQTVWALSPLVIGDRLDLLEELLVWKFPAPRLGLLDIGSTVLQIWAFFPFPEWKRVLELLNHVLIHRGTWATSTKHVINVHDDHSTKSWLTQHTFNQLLLLVLWKSIFEHQETTRIKRMLLQPNAQQPRHRLQVPSSGRI